MKAGIHILDANDWEGPWVLIYDERGDCFSCTVDDSGFFTELPEESTTTPEDAICAHMSEDTRTTYIPFNINTPEGDDPHFYMTPGKAIDTVIVD